MAFFVRVMALMWADILAIYALWMMMTYLTNVWKLGLTHAAAIINVFMGAVGILPLGTAFLVDTLLGNFWMLLLSSLSYSIGLGFLSMSIPPVLSKATGTCSAYEPECIGNTQKVLFYLSLALIAVGLAGHVTSLVPFMAEQTLLGEEEGEIDVEKEFPWLCAGSFAVILVPIIGAIALPYIHPWSVRFGIPAILTLMATLLFLSGTCSYYFVGPQGSSLTTIFRVLLASASKLRHRCPQDANQLYELRDADIYLVPHSRGLRCLDKAAIIVPSDLEHPERNRWRLCRVTEVEETKSIVRMIPMWMTFIICGIVISIGNTSFIEQANHMSRRVGHIKVPLPILLLFQDIAKTHFTKYFFAFIGIIGGSGSKTYAAPIGIATSMIFAVLCCITAAKVETRRLDVVRSHGLIDKPDETIPMSIFWLLPQFLLLGGFDGISDTSIALFCGNRVPPTMLRYMLLFTNAVFGLGILSGVLSVFVVGKISERGGKPSWFQDTLNKSRLDNYYWVLSALSAANLVIFVMVAIWYSYNERSSEDEEEEEEPEYDDTEEQFENADCCCC